jgi:ABC-2 type transport system permease protein
LTADFPFRVYSGHIPPHEAIMGVGAQVVWLLVLVWLGKIAMNKVLKRVVVQGG